jgi:hypothetical protein
LQNLAIAALTVPHFGHTLVGASAGGVAGADAAIGAPHLLQNFGVPGTSDRQLGQIIVCSWQLT